MPFNPSPGAARLVLDRRALPPSPSLFAATAFRFELIRRRRQPIPCRPFPVELLAFLAARFPGVATCPGHLPRYGVTLPAVVYNKIHASRWTRLSGPSGTAEVRYQLDCYDADDPSASTLDDQLRRALQPFAGMMGRVRVRECNLDDQGSEYFDPADASDDGTYRHRSEWLFIFDEPS